MFDLFNDKCYIVLLIFCILNFLILLVDVSFLIFCFFCLFEGFDCVLWVFKGLIFLVFGVILGIFIFLRSLVILFLLNWLVVYIGGIGLNVFGIVWIFSVLEIIFDEISGLFWSLEVER